MLDAVVFDFDGTLVDSVTNIWGEYQRVMGVLGLRRVSHREFTRIIGLPWDDALDVLWPGIDKHMFTAEYRRELEKPEAIEGVRETLNELSKDYMLAVMTSRGEGTLFPQMKEVGLDSDLFEVIFHKGNSRYHKPDQKALLQVCEALDVLPQKIVYVGDSVVDARCALDAGAKFIAVLTGGAYREDFTELGVEYIMDSVSGIPSVLEDIN